MGGVPANVYSNHGFFHLNSFAQSLDLTLMFSRSPLFTSTHRVPMISWPSGLRVIDALINRNLELELDLLLAC